MRKRIFIITAIMIFSLIAGDVVSVLALDTSDSQYVGAIREKNSSYTATNVCVPFTLNTDFLITSGYIESDCSDTAITLSNGTSTIPYMPAVDAGTDWIMFDNQISQNSTENFRLYIGGGTDMEGDIVYFPGTAGMTVADAASLEPGNNFEIELDGFINTSAGADKNLVYKENAFKLYVSGEGIISAMFVNAASITPGSTSGSSGSTLYGANYYGQTFTLASNVVITSIGIKAKRTGTVADGVTLSVYATAGGVPTGAALYSNEYDGAGWSTNYEIHTLTLSTPLALSSGVYAFTLASPNCVYNGGSNIYYLAYDSASTYNGGTYLSSSNSGSSWSSDANKELQSFSVNYCYNGIAVDAGSLSSDEHVINVIADATNLKLYVDGVEKDSEALAGASVLNNANDWVFCENNSVLYLRSADITVSGTLKGSWAWENDTTFTDLSGNSNDATPTFRTTSSDADVEAEIITLESNMPAEYETIDGDISPIITTTMTPPSELYDESGVRLPGADLINELLDAADIPNSLFWYPMLFGVAAFFGLLTYFFARDIMIQGIVNGSFLAFFGVMGGIPFWGVIPFALMVLAIIISRKTVSL